VEHSITRTTARATPDDQHVIGNLRPLALNADKAWSEVEDQVVPLAVGERLEDPHAELCRCVGNRELRDRSLLIGREHDIQSS
jgi:hypothetical protein